MSLCPQGIFEQRKNQKSFGRRIHFFFKGIIDIKNKVHGVLSES